MKKKILSLTLATAMVLGMTACGSGDASSKESEVSKETSVEKQESKVEESKEVEKENPAELRLIMYGDMGTRREEFFKGEFHDAVLEDLNIDLTVEFLTWGALTGDVQNRLMAGEKFAYMHVPSGTDHAQRGLCAEITQEQIDTYLPNHTEMRGNKGYDCAKVDGKIVVVPMGNKANSGNNRVLTVRNDILKEVGWDYSQITSYEKLLEACADVHEKYPDLRILAGGLTSVLDKELAGFPATGTTGYKEYIMVNLAEENSNVYSTYESEWFKNICETYYEWVELGYKIPDNLSDPSAAKNDWNVGNALLYNGVPGNLIETGVKANMPETADLRLIDVSGYPYYYTLDYDWAISVSVAAQDDVPDYLRLFDWIYESKENYEFCIYGVEGKDWERSADNSIVSLCGELMFDDWFLQATCYHTYDASISDEAIAEYEAWDDNAKKSKLSGFTFDSTNVAVEKTAMDAVFDEYFIPMMSGLVKYEDHYDDALAKLKAAGLDKYVEEYQKQYAAWYDENMK